jgi:hypothetical protein
MRLDSKKSSSVRGAFLGWASALAALSFAPAVSAYEVKHTASGELVRWHSDRVTFTLDPSFESSVARASSAASAAMGSWSESMGAPELEIIARDAASPTAPGYDQKNSVFYMQKGYAPAGRALAITVVTFNNISGELLDADVIFNGKYAFEVLEPNDDGTERPATSNSTRLSSNDGVSHDTEISFDYSRGAVYDLHHVVAHEFGHTLGLNDETDRRDALMYRFSLPHDASIRAPASDDVDGLAEIYKRRLETKAEGCGGATVAPKKPSRSASMTAMVGALAMLFFLGVRARRSSRVALVFGAAALVAALAPVVSSSRGVALASTVHELGHARAKVLKTSTFIESGLFRTRYELATTACRASACPSAGHGDSWGGTVGEITQEVGGEFAPSAGDEVDVSFTRLPDVLGALKKPLVGRNQAELKAAEVRVLTPARTMARGRL